MHLLPSSTQALYLADRHNQVARIPYQEINKSEKIKYNPSDVTKINSLEI